MWFRESTKKVNPAIGMPETRIGEWIVGIWSREMYDHLAPFKIERKLDSILLQSEQFRRGFFQGILDAAGYQNAKYLDITSKDFDLLYLVQQVLESLGQPAKIYGPYPYSRGVAHLRTAVTFTKTTERSVAAKE